MEDGSAFECWSGKLFFSKRKKNPYLLSSFIFHPPTPNCGVDTLPNILVFFPPTKHQMDSGYQGAVGGLLQVLNPHGIVLHEHARLAQMVFHVMAEKVEGGGYSGVYQGAKGL